jgi:glycosyltransferase involved in cell wall biosynthesis
MKNDHSHKVLIVDGSDFDSYPLGGINYFIKNVCKYAATRQDVHILLAGITCRQGDLLGSWHKKELLNRKWDCFNFAFMAKDLNGKPFVPVRIKTFLSLLLHLRRLLRVNVDTIYVHLPELAFLMCLFAPHRTLVVFHLHGVIDQAVTSSRYQRLNNYMVLSVFRFLNRYVIKRAASVITVSQEGYELCNGIIGQPARRLHKLPVMVDQTIFKPIPKEVARQQARMTQFACILLYVGRIEKVKGLSLLIDAMAILTRKRKDIHLVMAGEGSDKEVLWQSIQSLGLSDCVTCTGFLDHDHDLVNVLNAADLFVLSSFGEGCPTVVLEAQSCAIPVVATAVGELKEIVVSGVNGWLADTRDPEQFSQLIEKALQQQPALAENSLAMSRRYSHELMGKKIFEILLAHKS